MSRFMFNSIHLKIIGALCLSDVWELPCQVFIPSYYPYLTSESLLHQLTLWIDDDVKQHVKTNNEVYSEIKLI